METQVKPRRQRSRETPLVWIAKVEQQHCRTKVELGAQQTLVEPERVRTKEELEVR